MSEAPQNICKETRIHGKIAYKKEKTGNKEVITGKNWENKEIIKGSDKLS